MALEESAAELLCENARGDSSNTVILIELKLAQCDSEPQITPYTKFHRNLRGRVFWSGRSVLERPTCDRTYSYKSTVRLKTLLGKTILNATPIYVTES